MSQNMGADELALVLQRHGLSAVAAEAARQAGHGLRLRTHRHGTEFAAMLDAETGVQLGGVLQGDDRSTSIGPHLHAMLFDRGYIAIHTHVNLSAFSYADAGVLILHDRLRVVAVVTADGTWYVLSRSVDTSPADFPTIERTLMLELLALRSKYGKLWRSGVTSQRVAWREHTHEAWLNIGGRLGLRYDRVEPE